MIEVREGSRADRDAILALRRRCFPTEDIEKQEPAFWDWQFADGRFFVAADGDRVVAHLGFIPRTYTIDDGEPLRAALACDAMTDPEYRRQGLFRKVVLFAREAIREEYAVSTAWQIRKAVLPAMREGGWEPFLAAPVIAKWLWRSAGVPPAPGGPPEADAPPHPVWHYRTFRGGRASITTRRTTLRGFDTVAITDLTCNDRNDARQLLKLVCRDGRQQGATLAAALITLRHPALPLFLRSGFLPTPHRFRLLVNVLDRALVPRIRRGRWALMWRDTDHL